MADPNRAPTSDSRKSFEQLARELECDEDEERFEEQVRRIAPKTEGPREEPEEGG